MRRLAITPSISDQEAAEVDELTDHRAPSYRSLAPRCLALPSPEDRPGQPLYRKNAMSWAKVELEPEVRDWLLELSDEEFGHVAFYIDLLEEQGVLLDEPYTRQLKGKLRELRFYLGRERRRISYFIAGERRIILLTVFRKTKMREPEEITRAETAMRRCLAEGHIAED